MHYLINKILNKQLPANVITDIDLYSYDPHQLPIGRSRYFEKCTAYFFTHLDRRRYTGLPRRTTQGGYWKASGRDMQIFSDNHTIIVGFKKILVFYKGKAPTGIKTPWVMHEFRVNPSLILADHTSKTKMESNVVCKIRYKQESHNMRSKADGGD